MSYDVIVIETVGGISKEYKFKNYKDFLDWELKSSVVNEVEITEGLTRLYKNTVLDLVKVGDTVVIKNAGDININDFDFYKNYIVEKVDFSDNYLPIKILDMNWVDFDDEELEIYKVIKN